MSVIIDINEIGTRASQIDLLTKEVEKHTPSSLTKILAAAIPVLGWFVGGIYLLIQAWQKSKTLQKLKDAVKELKIGPETPIEIVKIHNAAREILDWKPLEKKLVTHFKQLHIRFRAEASLKIESVFGNDWRRFPNFGHQIFPIYLALAREPENRTEALIQALPASILASIPHEEPKINRDQIMALRGVLAELEAQIKIQPKVLAHFSLEECIQDRIHFDKKRYDAVLDPERYEFEKEMENEISQIFGEMWTPDFKDILFPIYHGVARSLKSEDDLRAFILLPESLRKVRVPPKEYNIDNRKLVALRFKLKEMDRKLAEKPRLIGVYGGSVEKLDQIDRATDFAILGAGRRPQYFEIGLVSLQTVLSIMKYYYADPKYQFVHILQLFQVAIDLTTLDSIENTFEFLPIVLDQVTLYMETDFEAFQAAYAQWKNLPVDQRLRPNEFLATWKQRKIDELLSNPKYSAVDKNKLFQTVLQLRSAGESMEQFSETADLVLQHMIANPKFAKTVQEWRANLPEGHQENRATFFANYVVPAAEVPAM